MQIENNKGILRERKSFVYFFLQQQYKKKTFCIK